MNDFITRNALNPEWSKATEIHDWRNHVPDSVKTMWNSFTLEQRRNLVEWAESLASREEWE